MTLIKVRDVHYYVHAEGQGMPLLLLHGFTGSHETWLPYIPRLIEYGYRVIAPDLLGHGISDSPQDAWRYQMPQVGADIRALLDELDISHCHMLGYSMGGRLALYLGRYYPQYFDKIILESASAGLATEGGRTARRRMDERLADKIVYGGIVKFVAHWESLPMWSTQVNLSDADRKRLHAQRLKQDPQGLANSLRGMGTGTQPSLWDELKSIKHPVLCITGEYDTKFADINELMIRLLPEAQHISIAESGHAVHLEQSELFWHKTIGFLTTNE